MSEKIPIYWGIDALQYKFGAVTTSTIFDVSFVEKIDQALPADKFVHIFGLGLVGLEIGSPVMQLYPQDWEKRISKGKNMHLLGNTLYSPLYIKCENSSIEYGNEVMSECRSWRLQHADFGLWISNTYEPNKGVDFLRVRFSGRFEPKSLQSLIKFKDQKDRDELMVGLTKRRPNISFNGDSSHQYNFTLGKPNENPEWRLLRPQVEVVGLYKN